MHSEENRICTYARPTTVPIRSFYRDQYGLHICVGLTNIRVVLVRTPSSRPTTLVSWNHRPDSGSSRGPSRARDRGSAPAVGFLFLHDPPSFCSALRKRLPSSDIRPHHITSVSLAYAFLSQDLNCCISQRSRRSTIPHLRMLEFRRSSCGGTTNSALGIVDA